jgi:hypothetical protein
LQYAAMHTLDASGVQLNQKMTASSHQPTNSVTSDSAQDETGALFGRMAAEMRVSQLDSQRSSAIASGLMSRIRESALSHRAFVTLRHEARVFEPVAAGMRCHALRQTHGLRIELVKLDAGAILSQPVDVSAQEIFVMGGLLQSGESQPLGLYDLCLRRHLDPPLYAGDTGAYLFVRQLIAQDLLPSNEQAWWSSDAATRSAHWESLSEGVEIKGLRCVGDVVSTLARIAPRARVLDHSHGLDEDCMMLEGDIFLGDILLRANDYQVAPVGCNHVNSMSDHGALFYFHGCMPTAI